ncbi:hypothetical protein SP90_07750 [Halodesulfovibrio spirochaetisodalis]|uniref:Uncharacterized protein n=1 Tax=Halodesulfovibrio spirochaetisodalis TaxID=1560234 RepID=A0A1B7XE66_9BACT|nr:hypothetical protein SP90_07750 [Halodesulfovibrio spirochaetisodalis]
MFLKKGVIFWTKLSLARKIASVCQGDFISLCIAFSISKLQKNNANRPLYADNLSLQRGANITNFHKKKVHIFISSFFHKAPFV